MPKLSSEQIAEIPKLRQAGMSYPKIAQKFGLKSHQSIIYHCKKNDFEWMEIRRKRAREAKGYFKESKERVIETGIDRQKSSQYADYLRKENERLARTKIVRDLNGNEHQF